MESRKFIKFCVQNVYAHACHLSTMACVIVLFIIIHYGL